MNTIVASLSLCDIGSRYEVQMQDGDKYCALELQLARLLPCQGMSKPSYSGLHVPRYISAFLTFLGAYKQRPRCSFCIVEVVESETICRRTRYSKEARTRSF